MNDDEFLAAFEARTLEEFHHRDHIKVAYLYLRRYPFDEAMMKSAVGCRLWLWRGVHRPTIWSEDITRP